jgi:alpha-glucuronidase
VDPRYTDYARANASLGINGTVLNNVNARADMLTARYIEKAVAIADALRPWGLRVYLSARFSAPMEIGGLDTADPLDPDVGRWWRAKANEIYAAIPDFGGFLVKANSEGQPGPQDYGRSHADGANMLAAALAPHGGIVMWRAFVYSEVDPEDRVKQAFSEFEPLDGQFRDNVLVQVKNGPLDFQPREPFHPLFGAMPRTPLMMEFQVTQEYLGFSTHLVYLGAAWEEVLDADTYTQGEGSLVSDVIDGRLHDYRVTGMAGVANIGADRDWTGSPFGQANWYAFGRLAWDPELSSRAIAAEWLAQTFTPDPAFVTPAVGMMMLSREAVVNYMTPLGLTHIMGTGHHYGPAPWIADLSRPEWNPYYYHRATHEAIGFDRTASGSNAIGQYAQPLEQRFGTVETTPAEYLLWFHRLPWDHRLDDGKTLWTSLIDRYDRGVAEVERMQKTWSGLADYVDAERFRKVEDYLAIQLREARWWRDACIAYFEYVSGKPLPAGTRPPAESLEYYRGLEFPYAPGN